MQSSGGEGNGGGGHAAATYRGLRSRSAPAAMGDINVTPLVDVVLVLLLVFMVTAPMMSPSIDMSLPVANLHDKEPDQPLTVSINLQQQVFVDNRPLHLALLEEELRGRLSSRSSKIVYLRADQGLLYGKVIEIVDKIKHAGADQVGFVYVLPEEGKSK